MADLDIDHPDSQCVLNLKWPDCIITLVHRRSRVSRAGQVAYYIIVLNGEYILPTSSLTNPQGMSLCETLGQWEGGFCESFSIVE